MNMNDLNKLISSADVKLRELPMFKELIDNIVKDASGLGDTQRQMNNDH